MTENHPDTALVTLAKALEKLPLYICDYVIQILIAVCSDFLVTTLLLGSVALWLATNLWWAIAVFFLIFTFARVANMNLVANAITLGAHNITQGLVQLQQPAPVVSQVIPGTDGRHMVVSGDAPQQ